MKEGQFSSGINSEKFILSCIVFEEEEPTPESGLMTVDEFMANFEKKSSRHLTNNLSTYNISMEKTNVA